MVEFRVSDVLAVLVVGGTMVATVLGLPIPTFFEQAFLVVIAFYFTIEGVSRYKQLEVEQERLIVKKLELENPQ